MPPLLHRIAYIKAHVCYLILMVRDPFSPRLPRSITVPMSKLLAILLFKFLPAPQVKSLYTTRREA